MAAFIHTIPFVQEVAPFVHLCWKMGWNEANGGNLSWRLPGEEIEGVLARHFPDLEPSPPLPAPIAQPELDGEYFLVTGSGRFFRHALETPDRVFGIVKLVDGGTAYSVVWGFNDGGRPTSEFATHLTAHAVRKRRSNGRERIILHAHPPEFIALSFLEPLDTPTLTRALWEKMPECIVMFPDGVQVVPLLMPGTVEIAEASAVVLERSRIISWTHHGIFVSEDGPNGVFALVETIEKASGIHRKILSAGGPARQMGVEALRKISERFAHIMVAKPAMLDEMT